MSDFLSFGYWVRRRRKALDVTQEELARRVGCAVVTIRKIEADERRPSVQVAERLADYLYIPPEERLDFLRAARTIQGVDHLAHPTAASNAQEKSTIALKGYELRERISTGGFAAVFRAYQPAIGREVAIKIILPQYAEHPSFIRRFEAEAQWIARLEHPHIVPLYDYWRDRSGTYLVMRYMRGGNLRDAIAAGALSLATCTQIFEQVATALAFAHRFNIVHRDIKPGNVLLDEEGNVYLADFGIAKDLNSPHPGDQTLPGVIIGSAAYLSPEQIQGEQATPRTDIYSMGVLLYELLIGAPPFGDDLTAQLLDKQLHEPLPSLLAQRTDVPREMDEVIQKATAKRLDERYPDVMSMRAAFQRAIMAGHTPIFEREIGLGQPPLVPAAPSAPPPQPEHNNHSYYAFLDKGHPQDYRREESELLVQAIKARENRLVLSLPDMGVSNLLRCLVTRTVHLFEHGVVFVYINCNTLDGNSNADAFFEAIAAELRDQGCGDTSESTAGSYQRLKRLVSRIDGEPAFRVAIVVDEADALLEIVDHAFYRRLEALTGLNKRLCYIFAAGARLESYIDPHNLLFAGRKLPVGRLNERDCHSAILAEARRLEVEFDAAQQARLARLSSGHPGLLRSISSAAVLGKLSVWESEVEAVERLLTRDDISDRCQKLYDALTPDQQTALMLIASRQSDSIPSGILVWLQEFGLVEPHEETYRLFSPIFERFVLAQNTARFSDGATSTLNAAAIGQSRTVAEAPKPAAISKASRSSVTIEGPTFNKHGIIVAGKVLQEHTEVHVTRHQLRLIDFLLREQKICPKDLIAAYVYSEESGEVADQRIETLVKQVRKKLGEEYVKTHWGQGYEFVNGDATNTREQHKL